MRENVELVSDTMLAFSELKLHTHGGKSKQGDLDIAREQFERDIYRLRFLRDIIDAPRTIFDVGGHIGCFGLLAKSIWPDARLAAYEPDKASAELYRQNLMLNGRHGTVEAAAISYEPEKTVLVNNARWSGGGVLVYSKNDLKNFQEGYQVVDDAVPLVTLEQAFQEQVFDCVDLLKLDCETSEIEILRQMSGETVSKIGFIVGEYHVKDGGFHAFEKLVVSRFLTWDVVALDRVSRYIGNFAAGPSSVIAKLRQAIKKEGGPVEAVRDESTGNTVSLTFDNGPKVSIDGPVTASYEVRFDDVDTGRNVYTGFIKPGEFAAANPKYFVNWRVTVAPMDGPVFFDHALDLKHKGVLIELGSKSLGDTVAWMPYVVLFREKHGCKVDVSTHWNEILEDVYPEVSNWYAPGKALVDRYYARYLVGCYDNDYDRNKNNWRIISVQQVASDMLGLSYEEVRPRVVASNELRSIGGRYVVVSEFSTFQGKLWNCPGGWQEIVDYLNAKGYAVMSTSSEPTQLKNVVGRNNRTIQETIRNIQHAEFMISVSTGPMWLAYALGVPTIVISGFTEPYSEMRTECLRVINEGVCHGCYNDVSHPFDRGNWNYCPRGKNFECSRQITPAMVKAKIDELMVRSTASDSATIYAISGPVSTGIMDTDVSSTLRVSDVPDYRTHGTSGTDHRIHSTSGASVRRVLFLAPHCSTGGMPQYLLACVRELTAIGIAVEVVEWNNLSMDFVVQRDQIKRLCKLHSFDKREVDKVGALKNIIRAFDPDVVHLQEFAESWFPEDATNLFGRLSKFVVVETTHDSLFNPKNKRVLPDAFIHVCKYHENLFGRLGPVADVVEYVVSPSPRQSRSQSLKNLSLDLDKIHVLCVGLFTPNKAQDVAFAVAGRLPGVRFHFVGNQASNFANFWQPLMDSKPRNCTCWGERGDVDSFYGAMDMLLFPSRSELAPIVVMEALAWKMPVVMRNLKVYQGKYDNNSLVHFFDNPAGTSYVDGVVEIVGIIKDQLFPMGARLESAYNKIIGGRSVL